MLIAPANPNDPWAAGPAGPARRTAPPADFAPVANGPARPHPSVVRVIVPERNGMAFGSGSLIAKTSQAGFIITNWHVVRDAAGSIEVVFPDGFRSPAQVLKMDSTWDLAALRIARPPVEPVQLAGGAPQRGDWLTIAGYGSGQYRAASGRCTQYVSPGGRQPFEMVELSTAARQGDSGGPIFNAQGELAGVLFGAGHGRTTGSYAGRVQWFLAGLPLTEASSVPASPALQVPPAHLAQPVHPVSPASSGLANLPALPAMDAVRTEGPAGWSPRVPLPVAPPLPGPASRAASLPLEVAALPAQDLVPFTPAEESRDLYSSDPPVNAPTGTEGTLSWADVAGPTLWEQAKTVLAGIGALTLLFKSLQWISAE